ncbi:imm11 family protein [Phaeobacter inhibens]|uniref:imm11 family protein n=1 Tax=Phaeobacter inhibens TaxID=221822 RepID=UPI0021A5CCF7|nr:DUF1629 domain-containing protein [Phaeobacter inhibens]UWR87834.1 hypothetical protein K4L01_13850 [Phaeobacter inhibens]
MIEQDFEDNKALANAWSRSRSFDGTFKLPFSPNEWVPQRDIRFENGGVFSYEATLKGANFTSETKRELNNLHCVVQSKTGECRETIGVFSVNLSEIPLVNYRLMATLERSLPASFEFFAVDEVWDEVHNSVLPGGAYYLVNLLTRIDSWDKSRTTIYSNTRKDGTTYNTANISKSFLRGDAIGGASIWRDTVTSHVLCTETFRKLVEDVGCEGWSFREIRVLG